MSAVISECGRYRYTLVRDTGLDNHEGTCLFVMLNPSTADATVNDPTIRRCKRFAERWGCARLTVGNLYALRSPNPRVLKTQPEPIGQSGLLRTDADRYTYDNLNDEWLRKLCLEPGVKRVIAAWGNNADPQRALEVFDVLTAHFFPVECLGLTAKGAPKHPLARGKHYVSYDFEPIHFEP